MKKYERQRTGEKENEKKGCATNGWTTNGRTKEDLSQTGTCSRKNRQRKGFDRKKKRERQRLLGANKEPIRVATGLARGKTGK